MPSLLADEIKIRDRYVLPVGNEGMYYLCGTTDEVPWGDVPGVGFNAYRSQDLIHWEGPFPVFNSEPDFWGRYCFWAPGVPARAFGNLIRSGPPQWTGTGEFLALAGTVA